MQEERLRKEEEEEDRVDQLMMLKLSTACYHYTAWHPIGRDILLCFLSEVPVTDGAAQ